MADQNNKIHALNVDGVEYPIYSEGVKLNDDLYTLTPVTNEDTGMEYNRAVIADNETGNTTVGVSDAILVSADGTQTKIGTNCDITEIVGAGVSIASDSMTQIQSTYTQPNIETTTEMFGSLITVPFAAGIGSGSETYNSDGDNIESVMAGVSAIYGGIEVQGDEGIDMYAPNIHIGTTNMGNIDSANWELYANQNVNILDTIKVEYSGDVLGSNLDMSSVERIVDIGAEEVNITSNQIAMSVGSVDDGVHKTNYAVITPETAALVSITTDATDGEQELPAHSSMIGVNGEIAGIETTGQIIMNTDKLSIDTGNIHNFDNPRQASISISNSMDSTYEYPSKKVSISSISVDPNNGIVYDFGDISSHIDVNGGNINLSSQYFDGDYYKSTINVDNERIELNQKSEGYICSLGVDGSDQQAYVNSDCLVDINGDALTQIGTDSNYVTIGYDFGLQHDGYGSVNKEGIDRETARTGICIDNGYYDEQCITLRSGMFNTEEEYIDSDVTVTPHGINLVNNNATNSLTINSGGITGTSNYISFGRGTLVTPASGTVNIGNYTSSVNIGNGVNSSFTTAGYHPTITMGKYAQTIDIGNTAETINIGSGSRNIHIGTSTDNVNTNVVVRGNLADIGGNSTSSMMPTAKLGCYTTTARFGGNCTAASFGNDSTTVSFGNGSTTVQVGSNVSGLEVGCYSESARFGGECEAASFGNDTESVSIGIGADNLTIGNTANTIILGSNATTVSLADDTTHISVGSNTGGYFNVKSVRIGSGNNTGLENYVSNKSTIVLYNEETSTDDTYIWTGNEADFEDPENGYETRTMYLWVYAEDYDRYKNGDTDDLQLAFTANSDVEINDFIETEGYCDTYIHGGYWSFDGAVWTPTSTYASYSFYADTAIKYENAPLVSIGDGTTSESLFTPTAPYISIGNLTQSHLRDERDRAGKIEIGRLRDTINIGYGAGYVNIGNDASNISLGSKSSQDLNVYIQSGSTVTVDSSSTTLLQAGNDVIIDSNNRINIGTTRQGSNGSDVFQSNCNEIHLGYNTPYINIGEGEERSGGIYIGTCSGWVDLGNDASVVKIGENAGEISIGDGSYSIGLGSMMTWVESDGYINLMQPIVPYGKFDLGNTVERFGNIYSTNSYASSGFYQSSDERLKTFGDNIKVDFDALAKLRKSYFKWNNDDTTTHIGVSAQEVKEIYPEIVTEHEDGHLSVDYSKLSVIALTAVDELHKKNVELEARLAKIEALLAKITIK